MHDHRKGFYSRLLCGAAAVSLLSAAGAHAQDKTQFNIAPQPLSSALNEFATQSSMAVLFTPELTNTRVSPGLVQTADAETALRQMLAGTGLSWRRSGDTFIIMAAADPQGGSAAGDGAEVEALIVTAQKREEDIQDVPIAISAFTQEDLERSQIAGGPDLMTQIPNMTFTKTNFTGYSIQIRGIGTQAISATTDPAVAVAFNNTPFVRNRFFEQEFYDLLRVEVLRGPQGTLYGRNATAGVVNLISAKPKFGAEAKLSADIANYNSTRLEGMINVPLVEDMVALRLAGAWTKRNGYAINELTGNPIDGRDLWSTRLSLRFAPTDALDVNLIWEHFEEDDDRIRSGKQLCKKDERSEVGGIPIPINNNSGQNSSPAATFNQGCVPASLYVPESFQTPNGYSLPYYHPLSQIGLPTVAGLDPYASTVQSRDLRVIESLIDPEYRAKADVFQMQVSYDLTDTLTLQSETAYSTDELFSMQDYNRFNTARGAFSQAYYDNAVTQGQMATGVLNDGVFCDPQIGCSDRLVALDLSTAQSTNFSQEFRLGSDFSGPVNFSVGANYTRYDTEDKYYVFINTLGLWSALARAQLNTPYEYGVTTNELCLDQPLPGDPLVIYTVSCVYMDPNPIGSLNDEGHNYFLSKNPYRLISYAAFGELYYNVTDDLKITAGLRYTVDKKHAPLIPSWLLAGGTVGYPVKDILDLDWREPTGRLTIDWQPTLPFTDSTLLYASYAHGYKAGGANPPPFVPAAGQLQRVPNAAESVLHPETFDAEFVDAFEVGTKNTLLDGRVTLNASAFYYDYKGYQISQIVDRTAVNSNFDAEVWGLEIEADWRPTESLRLGFKGGYQKTQLADGMSAIDLMDRTAGNEDWVVSKPFPALASNCVLPIWLVTFGNRLNTKQDQTTEGDAGSCAWAYIVGADPITHLPYVPNPTLREGTLVTGFQPQPLQSYWAGYPGFDPTTAPNGGAGFTKDLGGNELPNAPNFTGTLTADYTIPLRGDWMVNLHTDFYYQSEAWLRIFNTEGYDKLKAYTNVNLAAIFTNDDAGWTVMAYVKNVMDRDSITGAFLNSDDSGLTTNVFLTEPRLYGLRVTRAFSDAPLLGDWFAGRRDGPHPFALELGGQVQRHDAPSETIEPGFASAFSDAIDPLTTQHQDLDLGDGRDVKLTYNPGRTWAVSLGVRSGETNHTAKALKREFGGFTYSCLVRQDCLDFPEQFYTVRENYSNSATVSQEHFEIVDFAVGRDVSIGASHQSGLESRLGAGMRYAKLKSRTEAGITGTPDWELPEYSYEKYGYTFVRIENQHTEYTSDILIDREFEGVGPILSWDASAILLGDRDIGRLRADLSVAGGILFGKQRTTVTGFEQANYYSQGINVFVPIPDVSINTPIALSRRKSVTAPVLNLGLGLSYKLDRFEIGAGYRWERYFDVVDGGYAEHEDADRTIDGPYFKLAIGFGG